jgi:hypothetical protein
MTCNLRIRKDMAVARHITGSGSSFWFMGCTNSFITDITVGFYGIPDTILVGGIPTPLQNIKVRLDHHPNYWGK